MADEAGTAGGGTLPAAAQKTLVEELSRACESLLAVLDFLKAAPVSQDPAAVVPAEVTEQIEQIGMQVAALGDQFEPPAAAAPPGAGVEMAAPEAPVAMSVAEASTLKGIGRGFAMKLWKSFRTKAASPAVSKAKVKLTLEQHAKLQSTLMSGLMDMLKMTAPMFNGMDEEDVAAALAPPVAEPPAVDPEAAKNSADEAAAAKALADAEAEKAIAKSKQHEADIADLRAKLDKIGKARGASNAAGLDAPPPPAPTTTDEAVVPYGVNLSKQYLEKQKAKQSGTAPNAGAAQ